MIDVLASEVQYRHHLEPVHAALPPEIRGRLLDGDAAIPHDGAPVLVASYHDLRRARRAGRTRIAWIEHGVGQSYGGDPETADHPAYPGGRDHDDVSLTLTPNRTAAARWLDRYPSMDVRVVGCPKLDTLPVLEPSGEPVVALSFHGNAHIGAPEAQSAWRHYRDVLPSLRGFRVIGHAHPRYAPRLRGWYQRAGIEFVPDFAEVCRRASVYVADNTSTLFEFAATGRPVVVLNAPWYRRRVQHGLRFWETSHVGLNVEDPGSLAESIASALRDPEHRRVDREEALIDAYEYLEGAARRAANALSDWAAS
jgi:hypothetical protein